MLQGYLKLIQIRKFKVKVRFWTMFPLLLPWYLESGDFMQQLFYLSFTSCTSIQIISNMHFKTLCNKLVFSKGCCSSFKVTPKKQKRTNKLDQIKKNFPSCFNDQMNIWSQCHSSNPLNNKCKLLPKFLKLANSPRMYLFRTKQFYFCAGLMLLL